MNNPTKEYKLYIVDDEYPENEIAWSRLMQSTIPSVRFSEEHANTQEEFSAANIAEYDAVLLDITLNNNGWNMSLGQALKVIGRKCPIMLVSFNWSKRETAIRVLEAVEFADVDIIQTLSLATLANSAPNEDIISYQIALWIAVGRGTQVT